MTALDQNKYLQFVNLLNENNFFYNTNGAVVSPLFNRFSVVSKQRDAYLYSLPNEEKEIKPFWKCPSKVHSCFFSEDGKYFLVILSVNSFQIYNVNDSDLDIKVQIKASVLAELLGNYKLDFSALSKVEPIRLTWRELIIIVDRKVILNLEWGFGSPSVKYSIPLLYCLDIFASEKFLFILSTNGIISAYDVGKGQKCQEELNARLANRSNSDVSVGHSFSKFVVHSNSKALAIVNQDEETILFNILDYFDVSRTATPTPTEVKKEKWSWTNKNRKPQNEGRTNTFRVIGKVNPASGLVVSFLQFSLKGLFIFYSILGQEKCTCFKVIDETGGDVLYNFEGLVESRVVKGGPLPFVMSDSILSICLGVLCNDYLIVKLCEVIPNFGFSKEMERTLLSQQWSGACDYHLSFLKIILNLHLNVFHSNLKLLSETKTDDVESNILEKRAMEKMDELFKVICELKSEDSKIKLDMLLNCFFHAVRLLDLTHLEIKKGSSVEREISLSLLKNVVKLFRYVKYVDPLQDEWITWREMTDAEVVQEAVFVGAVGLAHIFFVTDRNWSVDEVQQKFEAESHSWIVELISMGELEKARLALSNLGCNPLQHLKKLCLETNEPLLRDLLANHLNQENDLTEEEIEAWQFCRKIEGALSSVIKGYHVFDHKMVVSAQERVKIVMFRLMPYTGSLDLGTVLKYSNDWREMVLTEVYFSTGDIALEKTLKKELGWKYLLEMNQIDLLKSWIDITCDPNGLEKLLKMSDYLTRNFFNLFASWPITEAMLDSVKYVKCMTATQSAVLDHSASYGFFSSLEKHNLKDIIYRIESNSCLAGIRDILSKPTSNVKLEDFDQMIFTRCIQHDLNTIIMTLLNDSKFLMESAVLKNEYPWLDVWNLFRQWEGSKSNKSLALEAVKRSSEIVTVKEEDVPILNIATVLIDGKELSSVIEEQGKQSSFLSMPLVEIGWQTARGTNNRTSDVSLYDLLSCSNVPIDRLFLWQEKNKYFEKPFSNELPVEFPHFNDQVLGVKYGFQQNLDYIYYLKQGRPSYACNHFIIRNCRGQRRPTRNMIKRACGLAHGLALRYWKDEAIGCASVAFITMLGEISTANTLRIHLAAVGSISSYLPEEDRSYISTLVYGIISKDVSYLQEMASLLEASVIESIKTDKQITGLRKWSLAVSFCNAHNLPLPTALPKHLAKKHDWFAFLLCLEIFRYPYEQAIDLIEEIDCKILKSHLIRALTRTTLKLSTTSPSKSPPKILLEPESTGKDDPETLSTKDNKDVFQSFVTNIYTEVLNTIQTFTDRNIVLPWSCEQDPDSDVLLTLLKCESEPDTSKSLLISSIELQSPVLAILATCFQSDNVFQNLIAWYISSIPTSLSRGKRREEGQQLVDRYYGPKEVEILLRRFFSTGYFQTFYRGMTLFMSDNPLTLFVEAVHQALVVLNFTAASEVLKEFVVEMNHSRMKESTPFSKSWILKVVSQLIESVLTRPDVVSSVKRHFLRILAESELSTVDTGFPNYLLWYQICEILESSETNLDFTQLYDISMVSEELQCCLDDLLKNHQFTQALEICSLLSMNKDNLTVAMWTHQLETLIKANEDPQQLWTDCSIAFKDENVNPNTAASFYYDMSALFDSSTAESLKNKYLALNFCLDWRRCIEDTSSNSFREESDSIELKKWMCCLDLNFDLSILKNTGPIDVSFSLLVSIWLTSKVLVRSQVLDEKETERVEDIINLLLDQGDLHRALRVSAFFKSNNQDLVTITSCLKITHGEVTPAEISKYNALLIIPRKLSSPQHHYSTLDLSEYDVVPAKEQCQMLSLLDKLSQSVVHGRSLANKILVCYRLSISLDSTFKDVASERNYVNLLNRSITADSVNKLRIAGDLITLADLPGSELAKFLKDKIVASIVEFHSIDLVMPVTLWDVNLDSDFHLIINLIENPSLLGLELLNASMTLSSCNEATEVLIRAHDCYTSSCNVEGIGRVLSRARILAAQILLLQQWQCLVRLLVGIGRYTHMSYVFQMLKDNDRFEHLLRRGTYKAPGLDLAVSDFLKRYCPEDRELGKMVAAHFNLHAQLAKLWQEEGDDILAKLPIVDNVLKDTSKTRHALSVAMDNYSHAAQWFLQAGKVNRALKISYQAQMVALQISLLGGPLVLRIQTNAQLQALVNDSLSVAQALLVARAYDMEPDWGVALHERWVIKADKTFFADFKTSNLLTPQFLQIYSTKYSIENIAKNSRCRERMKLITGPSAQQQSPYFKDVKRTS